MDRKRYMRDIYSQYWLTAREKIYGFSEYNKNLCQYIREHVPNSGKLLEVAIGTGYPVADFLQKAGYSVYGVDISPVLIKRCSRLFPRISCKVGDAEVLDHEDNYFDCTYCFHSTFYFPNLNQAIDEMVRVTRPGGLIIFDINNRNNKHINRVYYKEVFFESRIIKYSINMAKLILRRKVPGWSWSPIVAEVPTYPESIYNHLKGRHISNFRVMVRNEDEGIEERSEFGSFKDYARLIFVITKEKS